MCMFTWNLTSIFDPQIPADLDNPHSFPWLVVWKIDKQEKTFVYAYA